MSRAHGRSERAAGDTLRRVRAQLEAIGHIGRLSALQSGDVESLVREITELGAQVSGCERVNVWLFNAAETELQCVDLYEATPARHSSGMLLWEQEYHHEIQSLKDAKFIAADDPLTDPRTAGYVETYLKPLRITSMLDAAIYAGDRNYGLLCFEHVGKPHHWEADEIAFGRQLADKIGLCLISRMRRQAEGKLRASEAALAEAQSVAHLGSWQLDLTTEELTWSDETYRILGVDPATFAPSRDAFMARVHPDDRMMVDTLFKDSIAERRGFAFDHRICLNDGSIRCVYERGENFFDDTGRPLRSVGTVQDITDRKRLEEELSFSGVLLKAATENSLDAILIVDADAKILSFNGKFLEIWKIPRAMADAGIDEPILRRVADQVEDREVFLARVTHLYGHPELSGSDELKLKDGRTVERYSTSLRGSEGKYLGRVWFFRDITERKAVEKAVRESEEKYRNLVESTTDYIWEIDADARFTYATPAFRELLGYESAEIVGKTPFELMAPAEAARIAAEFAPIAAARQPFSQMENVLLRKDGSEVVLETSGIPVFERNGTFAGYRGIDRDITHRKLTMLALQKRDMLLHAFAMSAAEFVTLPSLDEAIPKAMERVSKTIEIDRMAVLEWRSMNAPVNAPPVLRYVWNAPDIENHIDLSFMDSPEINTPELAAWSAPLLEGRSVLTDVRTAKGAVRRLLEKLGAKSTLLVPISVDGKPWGQVGFDSCKAERAWQPFEIEILNTLAELIGNSVQRERYVEELANANRIVQNSPTILYRLSGEPSLPMIYISQNLKLFGYDPMAWIASPHAYKSVVHPDDSARVEAAVSAIMSADGKPGVNEFRVRTSSGDYRWMENRYTPIRNAKGQLVEIEGIMIDVTERKLAEEKIATLARTDPLTGLANRRTFIERIQQAFMSAKRGGPSFAVLSLDLDRFKDINDTLGHPAGDLLLKVAAERLVRTIRETDLVARFGGDEFAVLQTDLGDSSDAGMLAGKLRADLAKPCNLDGNESHITASIGISVFSADIATPEEMLAQADRALYRAKEVGRDQYRFYSEDLDQQVRQRVMLAEELRRAVERHEFELYYQPQVALVSGEITGMEAQVRWNHPTRGVLEPSDFVPIAEKAGIAMAIAQWALDQGCRQMNEWRRAGIAPRTLALAVSHTQLKAPSEFLAFLNVTLKKWSLVPADLELDVTESTLARLALAQSDVLDQLEKIGIKIAIDDFGAKYSTLDYLRSYGVSRIKIPRLIVDAVTRDPGSAAMIRAIVGIARELRVEVVAQGVENEAQQLFLSTTALDTKAQGSFFSEPVKAPRAGELLRGRKISLSEGRLSARAAS